MDAIRIVIRCWKENVMLKILTFAAIILLFTGLYLPPIGIIDNSVIIGVGELCGFGALWQVTKAIDKGYDTQLKIKQLEVNIHNDENEHQVDTTKFEKKDGIY